jgi:hypothetical protein
MAALLLAVVAAIFAITTRVLLLNEELKQEVLGEIIDLSARPQHGDDAILAQVRFCFEKIAPPATMRTTPSQVEYSGSNPFILLHGIVNHNDAERLTALTTCVGKHAPDHHFDRRFGMK